MDRTAELTSRFNLIDANSNGKLEIAELRAVFNDHADEFLKFCDGGEKDGELTSSEFVSGIITDCTDMSDEDFQANWLDRMNACIAEAGPAAEDSALVTTSCTCGAVKFKFNTCKPCFVAECGCVDCIGKLGNLESKGGPALPDDIKSKDKCLMCHYYPDKFTVESGKDKLDFFKVREDANPYAVATCCKTIMLIDNPFYHQGEGQPGSTDGSGFVMFWETVTPTGVSAPTDLRWWIKDLPEDKLAAMSELPGFYLAESGNFETMSYTNNGEAGFAKFCAEAAKPALEVEGQTWAELLAECGGEVKLDAYE